MTGNPGKGFVLLAGGGLGAWIWERLIPLLRYPALAVDRRVEGDVRRASLGDCAGHVADEARRACFDEAIIVAHSGSGILAPLVPEACPAARRIVFVSAAVPAEGANIQQGLPAWMRLANSLAIRLNSKPYPARRMEKTVRGKFCNDCDEETIQLVLGHDMNPEPPSVLSERARRAGLRRVPGTYLRLMDDRTMSSERMERLAANYGCEEILDCPGDHLAMLGRPRELAAALNGIAEREWGDT